MRCSFYIFIHSDVCVYMCVCVCGSVCVLVFVWAPALIHISPIFVFFVNNVFLVSINRLFIGLYMVLHILTQEGAVHLDEY